MNVGVVGLCIHPFKPTCACVGSQTDWTHRHEELLLLLFLLLSLLPHALVFLLQLLQRSDLRLLEAKRLLLEVRSESGQLLLVALVLLAQRLSRQSRVLKVRRFSLNALFYVRSMSL